MILETGHPSAHEARCARRRAWMLAAAVAAGYVVLSLLDQRLYHALRLERWDVIKGRDWAQMLRSLGYMPTWLSLCAVLMLMPRRGGVADGRGGGGGSPAGFSTRPREAASRMARAVPSPGALGVMTIAAATLAGLLSEVLKFIVRRHRPSLLNDGAYAYDWIEGPLKGRGLGLASSHVGVVFGVVFVIAIAYPRTAVVLVPLAIGCTLTRLWSGAHFVTDAYVAAALAWYSAWLVWRVWKRNA